VSVGADAQIVYDTDDRVLGYDPDGAGGAALLAGAPNLTAADLVAIA